MKQCQLVMVTSENNNKFYNMVENGNVIDSVGLNIETGELIQY